MAIIGIDHGASNSAVAALQGGWPVIISGAESVSLSGSAFPSFIAISADGQSPASLRQIRKSAARVAAGW